MPPKQAGQGAKRGRPAKNATAASSNSKARSSVGSARNARPSAPSDDEASHVEGSAEEVEILNSDEDDAVEEAQAKRRKSNGQGRRAQDGDGDDLEETTDKKIPSALMARLLQDTFQKEGTRMTADAAKATTKYIDVFVREAIARCMHERGGGFLEVEDLEKVSPQLLMDF